MLDVYHNTSLDNGFEARSLKCCGKKFGDWWAIESVTLGSCSPRPETNVSLSVTNTKQCHCSFALSVLTCTTCTASLVHIFEFATIQAALTFIIGTCHFSSCSRRFETQKAKIIGPKHYKMKPETRAMSLDVISSMQTEGAQKLISVVHDELILI